MALNLVRNLLSRLLPAKPRRVIYTCMFGYSEAFVDRPVVMDGRTDYICFTDDPTLKSERWKFIYVDPQPLGPPKTSKLIKLSPHLFLGDYQSSLYVDNTVRINRSPDEIWSYFGSGATFLALPIRSGIAPISRPKSSSSMNM